MKCIKNRDGYALLFVLFLVVLFIGLSAVFVAASFNNSKQERTVDIQNQSVVAAEMGVKYNLNNITNEIEEYNLEYKFWMNTSLNSLIERATTVTTAKDNNQLLPDGMSTDECNIYYSDVHLNRWITCETDEIEKEGLKKYTNEINSIYTGLPRQRQVIDSKTEFQLSPISLDVNGNPINLTINQLTRSIEIPLEVKGKQDTSEKIVNAKLIVTIPNHTSESNDVVIKTILSEEDTIDRVFIPPNDNTNFCPLEPDEFYIGVCKYTGINLESYLAGLPEPSKVSIKVDDLCYAVQDKTKCNLNGLDGSGIAVYIKPSSQSLNIDNLNNLQDISMYIDGELIIKNNNSADNNTIVSRAYSLHVSMNITNSNIVVLGDETKSGYIDWKSSGQNLKVSTNSKLCINLNGINLSNTSDLTSSSILENNGQLILYPSRINTEKLPAAIDGKIVYMDDFVAFLNKCNVNTAGLPEGHSMKQFIDSSSEIVEIVEY